MRLVSHPNVVDLRAFFYSNGDKVDLNLYHLFPSHPYSPFLLQAERRNLPQSRPRIHPRNRLPRKPSLLQTQTAHADAPNQTIHVPAPALPGLHPFSGDMSSRYQTSEPAVESCNRRSEVV